MNRRGFLSLVGFGTAALVVERALPEVFRPRGQFRRMIAAGGEPPPLQRFVMSFVPELGGAQEIVPPGGVTSLVARSQILFRPDRLFFPGGVELDDFDLLPLPSTGAPYSDESDSLLVAPVPLNFFGPTTAGVPMQWGAVHPGDEIVLTLRNITKRDALSPAAAAMAGLRAP